jgi:tRNA(fMet)-specific endonuclease VapC
MEKKSLVLCDTNIIIEFYKGNSAIIRNLQTLGQENIAISIITVGELLYGALNKRELQQIQQDIDNLVLIQINSLIGECFEELMVTYTLSHRLSLPDGLIAATALVEDLPLYTLNQKDFRYINKLRLYQV